MKKITKSDSQTRAFGREVAGRILKDRKQRAFVLCLEGDLGGGKTTFTQGLAKGLGIRGKILSPTFVIMKSFAIPERVSKKFRKLFHLDCYRIRKEKEILELGFKKIASDQGNIIVIEWSERIKKILPRERMILKFNFIDKNKREIIFK